ncbi:MAG: MBL fold metallo-hydrolase [Oscillospiraceae bacterium]|nr:MBL fold metallo-hydrolase [Oscillospiraceae bacterium]
MKNSKSKSDMKKNGQSIIIIAIIALITIFGAKYFPDLFDAGSTRTGKVLMEGTIEVHFIDVGQGDSTLIVMPDNKYILIDAGTNKSEKALKRYLDSQSVKDIEYAIFTHPHEDHIGGADMVVDTYNVKNVILPDMTHDTVTFERMINAIDKNNVNMIIAESGDVYTVGEVSFKILAPINNSYKNLNDWSVVVRLDYGGTSFMFTGDAEKLVEKEMLNKFPKSEFTCDVLKVGHHGSTTSTSADFLNAVAPIAAVIFCETGNSYGHPHKEIVDLLNDAGVLIYRTDKLGDIVFVADGMNVSVLE